MLIKLADELLILPMLISSSRSLASVAHADILLAQVCPSYFLPEDDLSSLLMPTFIISDDYLPYLVLTRSFPLSDDWTKYELTITFLAADDLPLLLKSHLL